MNRNSLEDRFVHFLPHSVAAFLRLVPRRDEPVADRREVPAPLDDRLEADHQERELRGAVQLRAEREPRVVEPLGLAGGFLDAAGGGGWGAVVTSNLLVQGTSPRKTIGTVNTAEFFLTVTISATFIAALGLEAFTAATVGLLIGGVAAAPLGAFVAKRLPARPLLIMVGVVLVITSLYGIWRALA